MTPFCLQFFKSNYPEWRYGAKTAFFKDSKCSSLKNDPFCPGIFQIWLLGEEIWGKNYIFQDSIELLVFKTFILKKWPPFVLQFFKSDYIYLERRYGAKTAIFISLSFIHYNRLHITFQMKAITSNTYKISIGSQCSLVRYWVALSLVCLFSITFAAVFCTYCIRFNDFFGRPMSGELLKSRCEIAIESMRVWQVSFVRYSECARSYDADITALHFILMCDLNRRLLFDVSSQIFHLTTPIYGLTYNV